MNYDELQSQVITVINEIQTNSGRPSLQINGNTRPLADLQGFDSINAVESTIIFSEHLGCDIEPDIAIFAHGGRPRSISEITRELLKIVSSQSDNEYEEIDHERE